MGTTKSATTSLPATTAKAPVPAAAPEPLTGRRPRRGLKRLRFQVPKQMPWPVRGLWQGASAEEQARAHTTATAILRTWLGKATREEAAKELGLSGIRLWQLSQQAVCGLVVGCLRQPRHRGRPPAGSYGALEEGLGALRKRIAMLERELDGSRRLIEVLRDLPLNRERAGATEASTGHGRGASAARRGRVERADDAGAASASGAEASDGPRR